MNKLQVSAHFIAVSKLNHSLSRVLIEPDSGVDYYIVGYCFNLKSVLRASINYLVICSVLIVVVGLCRITVDRFADFSPYGWINRGFIFFFGNVSQVAYFLLFFVLIFAVYTVSYKLSPRKFWLQNKTLLCRVKFCGLIPVTSKISKHLIDEINVEKHNSKSSPSYSLKIKYHRKLPMKLNRAFKLLPTHLTQGSLLLVSGLTDISEAESIQSMLLSEI